MTNELLTLEYVCTGNNGRSPMAEAIANDYLHRQGLEERVKVRSSGSGLYKKFQEDGGLGRRKELLKVIEIAAANGIFQESWRKKQATSLLQQGRMYEEYAMYADKVDDLFSYVVRMETILRDQALTEIGLVANREYHKPTTTWSPTTWTRSPDKYLILPMTTSNAEQVKKIYIGHRFQPKIALLNEYAGMSGDIPNPFCQLLPTYRESRDHLMIAVPKTIDRVVQELLG